MKIHTTNYENTFIEIALDCAAIVGEVPPSKSDKQSIATMQFELISKNPYKFSSDDIVFQCYATKNDLSTTELAAEKEKFFSKGQPCLRASPLSKRYGWGIHFNEVGKIAIFGAETEDYKKLVTNNKLKILKAMRSKR